MSAPPIPETEYARLMALARYQVLDAPPEESFERITALVREVLGVPMVMINFVDQFRNWSQSCVGGERGETPRDSSFCTWAILDREPTIISDARRDPRFAQNPGVLGAPFVQFYGGVPLITPDGHAIGTLCVIDSQIRPFAEREIWLLSNFAQLVVEALELRVRQLELTRQVAASAAQVDDLRRVTAHAQTLSAITALFGDDLEPALATEASAALLSQAIDVDWSGLLIVTGSEVQVLSVWDDRAGPAAELVALDLAACVGSATDLLAHTPRSVFIDDYLSHPGASPHLAQRGVRAAAVVALGRVDGSQYLLVTVRLSPRPWLSSDRALCEAAGRSVQGSLERRAHLHSVERAAWHDSLTGVGNRRAFDRDHAQQAASGVPYALLMIDLDGMKAVNDEGGHERGDALLHLFARRLQAESSPLARAYRLGGDEFALLSGEAAESSGARLLSGVERAIQMVRGSRFPGVAASVGLAGSAEVGVSGAAALLRLADDRMYRHKRQQPHRAGITG